jgi:hypothetical protein
MRYIFVQVVLGSDFQEKRVKKEEGRGISKNLVSASSQSHQTTGK